MKKRVIVFAVSDSKPQRKSQTVAEVMPIPRKATEQTVPTQQQQRSGSGALECMVSFKSMERARSTLEDFVSNLQTKSVHRSQPLDFPKFLMV